MKENAGAFPGRPEPLWRQDRGQGQEGKRADAEMSPLRFALCMAVAIALGILVPQVHQQQL
jgi:hypothetical protein